MPKGSWTSRFCCHTAYIVQLHLHPLRRRDALDRFLLREVGDGWRRIPGGIVQTAVQTNGPVWHSDNRREFLAKAAAHVRGLGTLFVFG